MIIDGVYYQENPGNSNIVGSNIVQSIAADGRLEREYQNHAHDLIQPHNPDGTPNEDFIEYYPDIAKQYGFIKESE